MAGKLRIDLLQLAFINRHFIRAMRAIDGENPVRVFGRLIFHNEAVSDERNAMPATERGKTTI